MPRRLQRFRRPGWVLPDGAVYVGRPTEWASPYYISGSAEEHIATYRKRIETMREKEPHMFEAFIAPLRGKDLVCYCDLDLPCHADVLLELANSTALKEAS
jgi:hypothetical protein